MKISFAYSGDYGGRVEYLETEYFNSMDLNDYFDQTDALKTLWQLVVKCVA